MKLDRLSDITSELSSNLVRSIVLPEGFLKWLSGPLADRLRDKSKIGTPATKSVEAAEVSRTPLLDGPTLLFGGAPVPDEAIVAMIHLAGGRAAHLAVIPIAAENQAEAAQEGLRLFSRFGMKNAQVLELVTRERAESPEWASKLASFDAVLLCGDNAALGAAVLRDTLCAQTLVDMQAAGKPVAGLRDGAAMLGELIVPRQGEDGLTAGVGLVPGMLIESEFSQLGRLVKALNTDAAVALMGIGLEAGTALVVRDGEAKVLGEASATFVDQRERTPVGDVPASQPGAMAGLKVHVLMDGFGMNLRTRKPQAPVKEPAAPAVAER